MNWYAQAGPQPEPLLAASIRGLGHGVQTAGGGHRLQPLLLLLRCHIVGAIFGGYACRRAPRGCWASCGSWGSRCRAIMLDAAAIDSPAAMRDQARRGPAARSGAGFKRGGQLVKHVGHHLGLHHRKIRSERPATSSFVVPSRPSRSCGQRLCLGGQCGWPDSTSPSAGTLADGACHGPAHVPAADKNPMVLIILTFPSFLTQKEINGTHIRSTPSIVSIRSQKIKGPPGNPVKRRRDSFKMEKNVKKISKCEILNLQNRGHLRYRIKEVFLLLWPYRTATTVSGTVCAAGKGWISCHKLQKGRWRNR